MIRVSRTFTRPNTNVVWFQNTSTGQQVAAERVALYGANLSAPSNTVSPDGKTWTYTVNWTSQADYDTAMADSRIIAGINQRKSYNAANGILESETFIVAV